MIMIIIISVRYWDWINCVKASLEEQQPDDKDPKVVLSNTKCFVTYTTLGIVIWKKRKKEK